MSSERPQKTWKKDGRNLKSEEKSRPSRLRHCWDRPEYLRRFALTWTPVNDHKLTLLWKTYNNNNNDNNKTQQNSKCRLCGDRDETINHIISECSKLVRKEYKIRHNWVGKVIHWKMCKKFKFDHTNKWYMHNPAPVLENNTHKLLWDFDIHTDHLISTRWPGLIIINKKRELAKLSTLLSRLTIE